LTDEIEAAATAGGEVVPLSASAHRIFNFARELLQRKGSLHRFVIEYLEKKLRFATAAVSAALAGSWDEHQHH
jgi:hypothetical protein